MRYAVNLYDWLGDTWGEKLTPQKVLVSVLLNGATKTVNCEGKRMDGDSIMVEDVAPEQWNAIVTLLRSKFDRPKHKYRLYQSKTGRGGWKRV